MSHESISEGTRARLPAGPRRGAMMAALAVVLIPMILVPLSAVFASLSAEEADGLPIWAVQAFRPELLVAWVAAARLPAAVLLGYGLIPLAVPPALAALGWGSVGRWAALAAFCLLGSVLTALLGLGVLLELIAPGAPGAGIRLEVLAGLCWPLLAIEGGGCLLAAALGGSDVPIPGGVERP
ncbi:hypothetical protein AB1L88_17595 [Tautonia sp. JC769]|uniref:hypothetical protein n=1 Tax=Tautonia sp. JC769 TaxID=3232135 RepID=UPI003458AE3D